MKLKLEIFKGASLLLFSSLLNAQELQIQYLANMGVSISNGESFILVDALFDNEFETFDAPSEEILKQKKNETAKHEGQIIILVTHFHGDHYNTQLTEEYLDLIPKSVFIGPGEATKELSNQFKSNSRVYSPQIDLYGQYTFSFDGIEITAFNLNHMGNLPWKEAINYGYLININNKKILHLGDASFSEDNLKAIARYNSEIDVAIVHFSLLEEGKDYLSGNILEI